MLFKLLKGDIQDLLDEQGIDIQLNGNRPWDIQIKDERFFKDLRRGSMGLGESYMKGYWEAEALDELFYRIHKSGIVDTFPSWVKSTAKVPARLFNLQTKTKVKKVADLHYSRRPELFEGFLDPYFQYTSGYFDDTNNLEEAQLKRLKLIWEKLQLKSGDRLLDIGCGWGGLAKFFAERGIEVTGINISERQLEYARQLNKGLPARFEYMDYRDLPDDNYDAVTSCGMIEHVGYKNYRKLFDRVKASLKEGGLFFLDTVGTDVSTTHTDPWIEKYIFPNSMVPSLKQLDASSEGLLKTKDFHNYGHSYDKTCMAWCRRFNNNWPEIKEKTGYDETFRRMWNYYLQASAAAFRAEELHNFNLVYSNGPIGVDYKAPRKVEIPAHVDQKTPQSQPLEHA